MRRFGQLQRSLGIAPNVLAARLNGLVDSGILVRRRYHVDPDWFEYPLTDAAREIVPASPRARAMGRAASQQQRHDPRLAALELRRIHHARSELLLLRPANRRSRAGARDADAPEPASLGPGPGQPVASQCASARPPRRQCRPRHLPFCQTAARIVLLSLLDHSGRDYGTFLSLSDPDGNSWMVQEVNRAEPDPAA